MMPNHYREVGIKSVDFELTKEEIVKNLKGADTYVTTRFIVLRNGDQWAVVKIRKKRRAKLFPKILGLEILSLPEDTAYCENSDVDVHNRTLMARLASEHGKKALVVQGRFEHISFIMDEPVLTIRIIDVEPPDSRLVTLANEYINMFPLKRAVKLEPKLTDLAKLHSRIKTKNVMYPCRASRLGQAKNFFFLDESPELSRAEINDITLVGCPLSRRIFLSLYKSEPQFLDICPREETSGGQLTLTRCCKVEHPIVEGRTAVVNWGANIQDVAIALGKLVKLSEI
jgi:hypothetical protein